jgi:hypothetical protein
MGKREFGDANVNMVVAQMDIKCGCWNLKPFVKNNNFLIG